MRLLDWCGNDDRRVLGVVSSGRVGEIEYCVYSLRFKDGSEGFLVGADDGVDDATIPLEWEPLTVSLLGGDGMIRFEPVATDRLIGTDVARLIRAQAYCDLVAAGVRVHKSYEE